MKKNVLVTAVGGRSVGSGILHALVRANKEVALRWNVIAADADPFAWGLYKTESRTLLPLANHPEYISKIQQAIEKFQLDAILPGSEAETTLLAQNAGQLGNCSIICNSPALMPYMNNKFLLEQRLANVGIKCIPTFPLDRISDALSAFDFPYILKPVSGTGGSRGLEIVTSEEELHRLIEFVPDKSIFCIQPYIGDAEHEYTVGILSDKEGNLVDSIVMKRKLIGLSLLTTKKIQHHSYSISTGYSQGFFVDDKEVSSFCEDIAKEFNSSGPLNLQLRKHNGDYYIFDFHPRFSGTTPMRADVGFNEADVLLRNHIYNEKFGRLNYTKNVAVIRAFEHVVVPVEQMLY